MKMPNIYSPSSGHAYNVNEQEQLKAIIQQDHSKLVEFLTLLQQQLISTHKYVPTEAEKLISSIDVSVGSTPSAHHHTQSNIFGTYIPNNNIEIHPGNYVFYDRQQLWVGSGCQSEKQISVRVLSRVISHYKDRNCVLLDCGALSLTKDASPQGDVCSIDGYPNLECYRMSQEVIMVRPRQKKSKNSCKEHDDGDNIDKGADEISNEDILFPFEEFPLEKEVFLIPNHSCLSAACFDNYYVIDEVDGLFKGDCEIVDQWIPCKGW